MRKDLYIILILLFPILINGCTEAFLEIDSRNNPTMETYYKTEAHAKAALASAYEPLRWPEFYGVWYFIYMDAASDDCAAENPDLDVFKYKTEEKNIQELWNIMYRGVFRCNIVLEKVPGIPMSDANKTTIIGEARFLRALYYWHLVTTFGEVPLVDRVLDVDELRIPKSNTAKIWEFIENDLGSAISMLPTRSEQDPDEYGHATRGAAMALLGKVYVYQEKWNQGRSIFEQIVTAEEYSLVQPKSTDSASIYDAWLSIFSPDTLRCYGGENNSESIFEIQCSDFILGFDGGPWLGWGNAGSNRDLFINSEFLGLGYDNLVPTQNFVNEFEAGDLRKNASVWLAGDILDLRPGTRFYMHPYDPKTAAPQTGFNIKKTVYPIWYKGNASPNNWRMIRYADVLLLYAECLYWTGGDPYPWINKVRARVGLAPSNLPMPEALIHERRVELGFETHRFRDLVRWSSPTINWVDIGKKLPGFVKNKHEYLPIPQFEIIQSGGIIKQNPAYQ